MTRFCTLSAMGWRSSIAKRPSPARRRSCWVDSDRRRTNSGTCCRPSPTDSTSSRRLSGVREHRDAGSTRVGLRLRPPRRPQAARKSARASDRLRAGRGLRPPDHHARGQTPCQGTGSGAFAGTAQRHPRVRRSHYVKPLAAPSSPSPCHPPCSPKTGEPKSSSSTPTAPG